MSDPVVRIVKVPSLLALGSIYYRLAIGGVITMREAADRIDVLWFTRDQWRTRPEGADD